MDKNRCKKSSLYIVVRPIIEILLKTILWPKIEGKENIPKYGKVILAGNHTSNLDCLLLMSSTKREIHFLAKIELFKGMKGIIFKNMGLIPVDRKRTNEEAVKEAEEYLKCDEVIGIFPEGTTEKGRGLMPFKYGACRIAKNSNSSIVPFVISGKYVPFKRVKIKFLSPIKIEGDIDKENKRLYEIIKEEIKEEYI
ncbi:MAG: 1-acyl-sn-glycerol-3-phosphate acyltransferase [Bacilli bacterium]|nr:1-acyl-sn-glycerol-3-phosphate acyltransferase [Bacilli bacterium]